MSTILYNTNSSLIPKFQKHNLLRQHRESALALPSTSEDKQASKDISIRNIDGDEPFFSDFQKNSDPYLQELCCSVYPTSLHSRICKLNPVIDLSLNAFASLVWKNFVTTWYGTKIRTSDDCLMVQLFDLVQDTLSYMKTVHIEYELFLIEDLPMLLSQHLKAMKQSVSNKDVFQRYCELLSYDGGYYPELFTNYILSSINCESMLQFTFLRALFKDVLIGKVLDKIIEPYYILIVITKTCRKLNHRHEHADQRRGTSYFQRIKSSIAFVGRVIALMTSARKDSRIESKRPFPVTSGFTFLFVDLLRFPSRKPYLYAIGKTIQYWSSKSKSLDIIMHNLFSNIISSRFVNGKVARHFSLALRSALFPNDNKMGPSTIIPTGQQLEELKGSCVIEVWGLIRSHNLDLLLGIKLDDIKELINVLCIDKRCNKVLFFMALDSLLAHKGSKII